MNIANCYSLIMRILLLTVIVIGCTAKEPGATVKPTPTPKAEIIKPKVRKECGGKPVVIAVIDTGLKLNSQSVNARLCKYGHKDFTNLKKSETFEGIPTPVPTDEHGHGTNIAGLIDKHAGNKNYCIVILKYYTPQNPNSDNLKNTVEAIEYAKNIGVKYINYSGGGIEYSERESKAVKAFLDKGGTFIAAAGNEGRDLDQLAYYPAMDDERVISVGNVDGSGKRIPSSNFGPKVKRWENGNSQTGFGITMTGTSQAAAITAGKIIKENEQECEK